MEWEDVTETVDAWAEKIAAIARDVRTASANVITSADVGCYVHAQTGQIGLFAPLATGRDFSRVKRAVSRATGQDRQLSRSLTRDDLRDCRGQWVKVAYSPTLRRAGELLNFFPGQYPGGIPNAPSPLAAMLTSGLVGAGLGWGGGKLLSTVRCQKVLATIWDAPAQLLAVRSVRGWVAYMPEPTSLPVVRRQTDPCLTPLRGANRSITPMRYTARISCRRRVRNSRTCWTGFASDSKTLRRRN